MEPKEKIIEVFRNNGFRATPQRIVIAQAVINNKDHPTAEQVLEIVARNNPSISLSTVYNTLHTMRDVNMLQELAFANNNRYDSNTGIHVNLVCQNCGEIIDIESENVEKEVEAISERRGFSITGHRFDLYGICRKCSINTE